MLITQHWSHPLGSDLIHRWCIRGRIDPGKYQVGQADPTQRVAIESACTEGLARNFYSMEDY
jgi:hypothetical protein